MISFSSGWAMHAPALEALVASVYDPKAIQSARPQRAERGQRLGIRDGVGILYVQGTLTKRDSIFTTLFGGTTYETLRRDLQAAIDDPAIDAIALDVDSPGGEVAGCDELATAIYEARKKKPTAAYISGMGCSAAYWLTSAAERVVVSEAAMLGSIGVAVSYQNSTSADEKRGIRTVNFVSSQSPNKGHVPEKIQRMVDTLADVFVAHVAKHRGVSAQTVIEKFGKGGIEVGAKAVKAGMADAVGSFEGMLADLRRRPTPINVKPLSLASNALPMAPRFAAVTDSYVPSAQEQAKADAAEKARRTEAERIRLIFNSEAGQALPERAAYFAYETKMPAADAIEALKSEVIAASWKRATDFINDSRSWK